MAGIPKQLLILKRLTAYLEEINPDNEDPNTEAPYAFDLRGAVFRGKTTLGVNDPATALSILESPKPEIGIGAGHEKIVRLETWSILLQGFVPDDKKNPTDEAYWLKAAVEKRLSRLLEIEESTGNPTYPAEFMLGRLLTDFTIGQGVVRPPAVNVSPTAFFYLPLVLGLKTDVRKPYLPES